MCRITQRKRPRETYGQPLPCKWKFQERLWNQSACWMFGAMFATPDRNKRYRISGCTKLSFAVSFWCQTWTPSDLPSCNWWLCWKARYGFHRSFNLWKTRSEKINFLRSPGAFLVCTTVGGQLLLFWLPGRFEAATTSVSGSIMLRSCLYEHQKAAFWSWCSNTFSNFTGLKLPEHLPAFWRGRVWKIIGDPVIRDHPPVCNFPWRLP